MLKYIESIKIIFSLIAIEFFLTAFETLKAQSDGLDFIKLLKELKSVESKPNLECQGLSFFPTFFVPYIWGMARSHYTFSSFFATAYSNE